MSPITCILACLALLLISGAQTAPVLLVDSRDGSYLQNSAETVSFDQNSLASMMGALLGLASSNAADVETSNAVSFAPAGCMACFILFITEADEKLVNTD